MSEPNPIAQRRRFGLHDLEPASRGPWWRRWSTGMLIGGPAIAILVVELIDLFRLPGPHEMSVWGGVAMLALWTHLLVRSIVPLAHVAWSIDGGLAAVSGIALTQRLAPDVLWITVAVPVALTIAVTATRRPPPRRALPVAPPTPQPGGSAALVAFSESASNPTRAALIVAGCVVAVGFGAYMVVANGSIGWWYFGAALVWLTGSIPWMLRVTLDRTGFVVRSLVLPGSLVRIPLGDIADLTAGIAYRKDWGGGGTVADDGMTSILRADGAALLVTRTDGTQVIVNVERPDEAIATFAALRAGGAA